MPSRSRPLYAPVGWFARPALLSAMVKELIVLSVVSVRSKR